MGAEFPWPVHRVALLAIAALMWVALALHTSLTMRRYGRRWWVWFIVSVFLTVLPAAVVSYVEYFRRTRQTPLRPRCDRCGAALAGSATDRDGEDVCPHCGATVTTQRRA